MKTHVLTQDVTIPDIGRCQAGDAIDEQDTHASTWQWLQQNRMLKSMEEIEQEADAATSESMTDGESVENAAVKPTAKTKKNAAPE